MSKSNLKNLLGHREYMFLDRVVIHFFSLLLCIFLFYLFELLLYKCYVCLLHNIYHSNLVCRGYLLCPTRVIKIIYIILLIIYNDLRSNFLFSLPCLDQNNEADYWHYLMIFQGGVGGGSNNLEWRNNQYVNLKVNMSIKYCTSASFGIDICMFGDNKKLECW